MRLFFNNSFVLFWLMKHILIIEDDLQLQSILAATFNKPHTCLTASSLSQAYRHLDAHSFDLIIVDRKLPDGDGIEILEYVRDTNYQTKLLALTSQSELQQRLEGLERGADEYLAKPFSMAELKLRVYKLLQMERRMEDVVVSAGPLQFSADTGVIQIGTRKIQLRKREAQIFDCLLRYKNQVVTREMLITDVWAGQDFYPSSTTLDVYIRRIRVQLREYKEFITTIRGFGYSFTE